MTLKKKGYKKNRTDSISVNKHQKTPLARVKKDNFPVVAVGASAGGLEAFELFFSQIQEKTGMAYVVITHLDRDHISVMAELIKKYTPMKVLTIVDGVRIIPNTIYVIPPRKNVDIKDGMLSLVEQSEPHYSNLPINFFFRSLALDRAENAVAIILSGAGTDGSLGARDIKLCGGVVMAQDPLTAKFDSMPTSVINAGFVDFILSPEQMSAQLVKWSHYGDEKDGKISLELQHVFSIIHSRTGYDFSSYKLNTICRRIEKQMYIHRLKTLADYVMLLRQDPEEVDTLFRGLLIGVTRFFRDQEVFDVLKRDILPTILQNKPLDYCIRVWVPGCSTGEEVYSIAITIAEYMKKTKNHYYVQIFGTDIDRRALTVARNGNYADSIMHDVSEEQLKRFFIKEKNSYKIKKEIRSMVVFGEQNLIKDPPFTKVDIISCRNLLIYLTVKLQKKVLPIFHYSLKPKGMLLLGMSESIAGFTDLFELSNRKFKFFERKDAITSRRTILSFPDLSHNDEMTFGASKNTVLIAEKSEGDKPPKKYSSDELYSGSEEKIMGIKKKKTIATLERELSYTKENLQATIEELESSNEELQSVNEELQSTNEEIETSKEELQSLNEELVIMNTELQNRIDQLATVHDDMTNLFNSTEIATFFLDNHLCIKRFTPKAQEFIHLIPTDIGRSISHFSTTIKYENLMDDAKEVLRTLNQKMVEVQNKSNRWFLVRILPYRTIANMIDGVIITLTDITEHKEAQMRFNKLNEALSNALTCQKNIIDTVMVPLLVIAIDLKVISANRAFYKIFRLLPEDVIGKFIHTISGLNMPELREFLEQDFPENNLFEGFEIEKLSSKNEHKKIIINARKIYNNECGADVILVAMEVK